MRNRLNTLATATVIALALGGLFALMLPPTAQATALSANRDTPTRTFGKITLTVKDAEEIYAGSLVSVDSNGEAVSATDSATDQVVGRAAEYVDNTDDGETIDIDVGVFRWVNGDTITDAHIGDFAYVEDDQTVVKTDPGNACIAGIIVDVDDDGVWVSSLFDVSNSGAGSFTTLSASGAATLSGSVTVSGTLDVNEDIDIDQDASDEEISLKQAAVAGPGDKGWIQIDDDRTGATATESDEATITIDAEGVYAIGILDGAVAVESVIDTYAAGALSLAPSMANAITLGASDITTTVAGTLAPTGAFNQDLVVVTDTNAYTVLANNSGQVHFVPDLTADCTLTMPAEAANLYYKFVYAGGAEDAQDWIIDTGADANYFVGGLVQHDDDDGGDDTALYYSDGNSNSKMTIYTPNAGTVVEMWCEDGTTWYVTGTVISGTDTGAAFADQ